MSIMADYNVERGSTSKLGHVDGELKVGKNAKIQAAEGISERFTACPSCREEVHFRHKLHLKGSDKAAPPR